MKDLKIEHGFYEQPISQKIEIVNSHKTKWILIVLFLVVLAFGIYVYSPQIASFYSTLKGNALISVQPLIQIFNPQKAITHYQQIWSSPSAKKQNPNKLNFEFINAVNETPLKIFAKITLLTNKNFQIIPQCYLDGKMIEVSPKEIKFSKSSLEQHASISCLNRFGGSILNVKLGIPLKTKSILTVFSGRGDNKGILDSVMDYASDYSLLLTTLDDQPLANGEYSLLVRIKRETPNVLLKKINSLRVSTISDKISIDCPSISGDRDYLSKFLVNKNNDGYMIPCKIKIRNSNELQKSFIEAEMDYTIEKEFKTSLS